MAQASRELVDSTSSPNRSTQETSKRRTASPSSSRREDDSWRNPKPASISWEEGLKLMRKTELPYILGRDDLSDLSQDPEPAAAPPTATADDNGADASAVIRSWPTPMEDHFDRLLTPEKVH